MVFHDPCERLIQPLKVVVACRLRTAGTHVIFTSSEGLPWKRLLKLCLPQRLPAWKLCFHTHIHHAVAHIRRPSPELDRGLCYTLEKSPEPWVKPTSFYFPHDVSLSQVPCSSSSGSLQWAHTWVHVPMALLNPSAKHLFKLSLCCLGNFIAS